MTYPFYTIGHSTGPVEEFVELLTYVAITSVADAELCCDRGQTRNTIVVCYLTPWPQRRSNTNLIPALSRAARQATRSAAEANTFWQNESFHNYARLRDGQCTPQ
jgi:hypothetical protein